MKKRSRRIRVLGTSLAGWLPILAVLSVSFMIGTLLGCYFAGSVSADENSALISYMEGYLSAARNGDFTVPALVSVLWETVRWPLLVFLLSLTAAGLVGIPIVFGIRGFLLSFAVASFVRVLGSSGAILAFLVFGLTGMLSFPVLFVLGAQGMVACRFQAGRLMGERRKIPIYGRSYWGRCGICAGILALCVCLEQTVIPSLMLVLAGTF